jgi:hypothetical protein
LELLLANAGLDPASTTLTARTAMVRLVKSRDFK